MTLHTKLSYIKSGVRIAGYLSLMYSLIAGCTLLIIAELLGVVEELPGSYKGTKTN